MRRVWVTGTKTGDVRVVITPPTQGDVLCSLTYPIIWVSGAIECRRWGCGDCMGDLVVYRGSRREHLRPRPQLVERKKFGIREIDELARYRHGCFVRLVSFRILSYLI